MDMIISRNKTTHTYDESVVSEIAKNITGYYVALFNDFGKQMRELKAEK